MLISPIWDERWDYLQDAGYWLFVFIDETAAQAFQHEIFNNPAFDDDRDVQKKFFDGNIALCDQISEYKLNLHNWYRVKAVSRWSAKMQVILSFYL